MTRKALIISCILLLVISLLSTVYNMVVETSDWAELAIYISLNLANIAGIYLLVTSGSILKTRYWKAMLLATSVVFLGALFKLQHWSLANPILAIGLLSFPLIYLPRFYYKRHKDLLDILKLIWIISFFGIKILAVLHIAGNELALVSVVILVIASVVSVTTEKKRVHEYDFDFMKDKKDTLF